MNKKISYLVLGIVVLGVLGVGMWSINKGLGEKKDAKLPICRDLCGDGECQEIVCLAAGCPCAETKESCPQDCVK